MKRFVYLDVLRGVAILLMVVDHTFDWWLVGEANGTSLARITEFLGTLAAPIFLFLVGFGLAISTGNAEARAVTRKQQIWKNLIRGARLILLGYLLNFLVFFVGDNPQDVYAVDILQIIGLSIILCIPFLWGGALPVLAAAIGVFFLGQRYGGNLELPFLLDAYLTGVNSQGFFPLLLWLPYTYLGLAAGLIKKTLPSDSHFMALLAALGISFFIGMAVWNPAWGYRHPYPLFIGFSLMVLIFMMTGFWVWTERWNRRGFVIRLLRDLGLASLMLYLFHHLVGYRLFWIFGWVTGRSWRGEYGVFSPGMASVLFLVMVGLMILASWYWLRPGQAEGRNKILSPFR